jgi:hypothetical protein
MEIHNDTRVDETGVHEDDYKEIITDEYLPRLFAPDTATWLYCSGNAVLTRKIPPPEDTGINGEFLGI